MPTDVIGHLFNKCPQMPVGNYLIPRTGGKMVSCVLFGLSPGITDLENRKNKAVRRETHLFDEGGHIQERTQG